MHLTSGRHLCCWWKCRSSEEKRSESYLPFGSYHCCWKQQCTSEGMRGRLPGNERAAGLMGGSCRKVMIRARYRAIVVVIQIDVS